MELVANWGVRPVFITSTFQDMQAERDWLWDFVRPAIEERLRQHRRLLEWIDLRLDADTADTLTEADREAQVLKVCLDEIRRSRPFLIALIGDRYGWVPPKDRAEAAATEAGITGDVTSRSVTDLEIEHGLEPDQRRRSLFFIREPATGTRAASSRNAGRDHVGTVGEIISEWRAASRGFRTGYVPW